MAGVEKEKEVAGWPENGLNSLNGMCLYKERPLYHRFFVLGQVGEGDVGR